MPRLAISGPMLAQFEPDHTVEVTSRGEALALGAHLTFVDYSRNSEKFHASMLVGTHLMVQYGKLTGVNNPTSVKTFATQEKAHAAYWALLRSKVAKGYHVSDSSVFGLDKSIEEFLDSEEPQTCRYKAEEMLTTMSFYLRKEHAGRRERNWTLFQPDLQVRSPRTPKQGAAVIAALMNPFPDPNELFEIALAADSERFVRPMAMSHPSCPDEARVAWALAR